MKILFIVLGVAFCLSPIFANTFDESEKVIGGGQGVSTAPEPDKVAEPVSESGTSQEAASSPGSKTTKYVVQPGDCLSAIAEKLLGDPKRFWEIVDANKEKYPSIAKNPNLIFPGWELTIPGADGDSGKASLQNPIEGTVEVNTSLNVRTGVWGKIIGSLHNGDKISIIGQQGDWLKIQYNGGTAFVHKNYVSTPGSPAGNTPVRTADGDPGDYVAPPSGGNGRFGAPPCQPMPSRASSEYGWRNIFGGRSFHHGIDLPVTTGTRLNALGDGVVTGKGYESGGGNWVRIRYDNGYESFYCHLRSVGVSNGQRVSIGQEVARSDNTGTQTTGAHLHMQLKKNGVEINPRNAAGLTLP